MKSKLEKLLCILTDEKVVRHITVVSVAIVMYGAANANAGTTGTEFLPVYDKIKDLAEGYLGKAFAAAAFLIGLGAGAFKGSPMPAIGGFGIAAFTTYGIPVLEGLATATLP